MEILTSTKFKPFVILFILSIIVQHCFGIRFYVQPNQKKCLRHEMYQDQLAVGEYEVSSLPETEVDMTITDSRGHIALSRDNIEGKGKFAVTTDNADIYDICFSYSVKSGTPPQIATAREVYIEFKVGAEAKQYETAVNDQLSVLEKDLNRIEDLTNSIIMDFAYLKKREKEMSDTNESTNTRLFYQTITSVIILLALTTWQILYLRTFFRAKKLID